MRTSFVAPVRTKLPSTCLVSWVSRIATSRFPMPRKAPTPMIAYALAMSGAMTISSTVPILSRLSLKTGTPSTWRFALQPRVANSRSSNAVTPGIADPATCACATIDVINAMLAHIRIFACFMSLPVNAAGRLFPRWVPLRILSSGCRIAYRETTSEIHDRRTAMTAPRANRPSSFHCGSRI